MNKIVLFLFYGLGILLVTRSGEGGEDMDVNGGNGDDDCYGIFWMCLKWWREKIYDGDGGW